MSSAPASPSPSFFHHQASTMFPKFLDGSFNGNKTNFNLSPKPKGIMVNSQFGGAHIMPM